MKNKEKLYRRYSDLLDKWEYLKGTLRMLKDELDYPKDAATLIAANQNCNKAAKKAARFAAKHSLKPRVGVAPR